MYGHISLAFRRPPWSPNLAVWLYVNGYTCKLYYPTSLLGVLWSPDPNLHSPKSPSTLLPSNGFYVHCSNCQTTPAPYLLFQCYQHILLLFWRWCWNRWGSSTSYSDTEKSMQSVAAPISSWQAAMTNKYHSLYPFTYVRWESTLPDSVAAVLLRMDLLDPKDFHPDFLNPCKSNDHFYETI